MIADTIANARAYTRLHPRFEKAFAWLATTDLAALPTGKIELDGSGLYASVQRYTTKLPDEARWESHRKYIDIQYMVAGTEHMDWACLEESLPEAYDADKDFQFHQAVNRGRLTIGPGQFAVFMPQDVHKPGLAGDNPSEVSKIVIKVRID